MSDTRITYLFYKYFDNTATVSEQEELSDLLGKKENESQIQNLMEEAWLTFSSERKIFSEKTGQKLLDNIFKKEHEVIFPQTYSARENNVVETNWWLQNWWSIAATVFLTLGLGIYYFLGRNTVAPNQHSIAQQKSSEIKPGSNKATLTLGDGSTIILDQAQTGQISQHGNTKILKPQNGQLVYNAGKEDGTAATFNTITTPRGGQYQITLAEGTKVWLNAASSLKYPTHFSGNERVVEMTGEGYFEVSKNLKMPFKVRINGSEVKVFGTSFNINGYTDEPVIRTTLLEGSVKVSAGSESSFIKPGQEADITKGKAISIQKADIEKAIAWKEGFFQFSNTSLQEVMRQIMRWYDVEVAYEGKISPRQFGGEISRESDLKDVLKILEISKIHFRMEGRSIVVVP